MNPDIRNPAVADMFYPGDADTLRHQVEQLLAQATVQGETPKAIIAPHAGYIYSGPVAASVYKTLIKARDSINKVVLVGPSHRVPLLGCACSSARAFATPLGEVPLNRSDIDKIKALPFVSELDQAHSMEHCLEVQLPFLQVVLSNFTLVPIVVGDCDRQDLAQLLDMVWGDSQTLIVVSSDLSHYHDYNTAVRMDRKTCEAIENSDVDVIDSQHACGAVAIRGLLETVKDKNLIIRTLDYKNSGDTAGSRDQVVGYAAVTLTQQH